MSLVSLFVFVLAVSLAQLSSAEPRRLSVQLIDRWHLQAEATHLLCREVNEAWRDELAIEWTTAPVDLSDPDRPERLYVILTEPGAPKPHPGVIAAIPFLTSGPRNQVSVYPAEAERLLALDPSSHYLQLPFRARNEALGRVLGRAIAHEIGHYARNSSGHSPSGLMRASHPIAVMAGPDRSAFSPGPAQIAEECSLLVAFVSATTR
jgi:hypothetical protein